MCIVDALGNPLALRLTGGPGPRHHPGRSPRRDKQPEALLGDKGYDADAFIETLEVRGIKPVIPPKSNRKVPRDCDFALYAERNLVERFFNSSNSSEASQPATKKPPATSSPACIWSAPSLGSNDDTP